MSGDEDTRDPVEDTRRFQEAKRRSQRVEDVLAVGTFVLLLMLCLLCCGIAPVVFKAFGPAWGLLASVAAVAFWVRVGPPASPGLLPGCLAMAVLIYNGIWGLFAVVQLVLRLVHYVAHHHVA